MAIPNQTPYTIYTANGVTTVFPFNFMVFNATDLAVSVNGTVLTSGFTVSGVGVVNGGSVTFLTPPASGATVMLARVMPLVRVTEYQDNGDLLADTVNKDFTRLWMAIQQAFIYLGLALTRPLLGGPFDAKEYRISNVSDPTEPQDAATKKYVDQVGNINLGRTLRVPENYVEPIPSATLRANKILGFNNDGQPVPLLPESGSAADVLLELASSEEGKGDSLIAVKQPYAGSVTRNQHDFNSQFVSVKDFGDSFEQAHISAPASKWVLVPSGNYNVHADIDCTGRVFIFEEPVNIIGVGKMLGAVIHRHHPDGSVSYGVGGVQQRASKYRYGSVNHGPIGLQIGGAEKNNGADGNVLFADAYLGWSDIQPSKYGSAVEFSIQPSSINGKAYSDGSDMVRWISGEKFTSNMYLRRFYFNNRTYRVKTVVNETTLQVMNINTSTVSVPAATAYWKMVGVILNGKGKVSGKTLTRIDGDPFVIMGNTEYIVRLNGVTVLSATSVTDPDSLILAADPGILGDVTYEIYTSIDDISSALRVHAVTGAGHEENVTLAAYASGKFQLHAGSPQGNPLILGCQWDSEGEERGNIVISSDGITRIGGLRSGGLEVPYTESRASSAIRIQGNDLGESFVSAIGPTNNVDLYLATKGEGHVGFGKFNSTSRGDIVGYIEIKDGSGKIVKLAVIS